MNEEQAVVTPYLCAHDARAALAFYTEAFGAFESFRVEGDDGRLGHVEFTIGGAPFYMSDEYPEIGVVSPRTLGASPVSLYLRVADVDYVYARAVEHGARGEREPADQNHGNRTALVVDPFGHRWMLAQPIEVLSIDDYAQREREYTVTEAQRPIELGYVTMRWPDTERAARFYGELFGWRVQPGNAGPGHFHIENTRVPMGMAPADREVGAQAGEAGPVTLYWRVDSIERFAARVVELGGRVLANEQYESGGNAECVDDQGVRFDLFQPAPGY